MTSTRVMNDKPVWERDGRAWPNRDKSRFVDAGGLTWHVQIAGQGPVLLLIHGTAASSHSWGDLLPLLAERFTVVAPDLPGHGFTSAPAPEALSLPGMSAAVGALVQRLGLSPEIAVGHSAGAAILARMSLDGLIVPRLLISLSGALLPLRGLAGKWFSPAAKLLARSSLAPRMVALRARRNLDGMQRLVDGTGSKLTPEGIALYRLLVSSPGHVAAALNMMANWELETLQRDLPRLVPELLLVGFSNDKTVPPEEAERAHALLPRARLVVLGGYGHLAHEEDAARIAELIFDAVDGVPPTASSDA
jgi:magnesium chelatase accessory protein